LGVWLAGYTETRRACCAEGLISLGAFCNAKSPGTCSDPSTYMFFDSAHPTESVYKFLAKATWNNMVSFFGLKNWQSPTIWTTTTVTCNSYFLCMAKCNHLRETIMVLEKNL